MEPATPQIVDYNGIGDWSLIAVQARYTQYAAEAGLAPRDLSPRTHTEGERRWIYPVIETVTERIEARDPAAIRIGIEFIEEDQSFTFGRILKPKVARALRRAPLTEEQKARILRRIFSMLQRGYVPHEYYEYSRLARQIGFTAADIPTADLSNHFVARYHKYFVAKASPAR